MVDQIPNMHYQIVGQELEMLSPSFLYRFLTCKCIIPLFISKMQQEF